MDMENSAMNSKGLHYFEALKDRSHEDFGRAVQWAIDIIEAADHLIDSRHWPRHDSDIRDLELRMNMDYSGQPRRLRSM